jgi:hypothetical protein
MVQPPPSQLSNIANMKKTVRRLYQEHNLRLNNMEFDQLKAFIGAQISAWDPMCKQGRGIPSSSLAASIPWIFAHVSDEGGVNLGSSQGVPVFIDFFRRDSERINSNMVVIGKSGSGKSYATKSLLTNLAAEDSKIFILDPENEYTALAENLHGKFINVGNAQYGRLNPFHIITALEDDESGGNAEKKRPSAGLDLARALILYRIADGRPEHHRRECGQQHLLYEICREEGEYGRCGKNKDECSRKESTGRYLLEYP